MPITRTLGRAVTSLIDRELPADPAQRAQLLSALLELYAGQAHRTWRPILVFNMLILWMVHDVAPSWLIAPWLVFQAIALACVPLAFRLYPADQVNDTLRLHSVLITRGLRGVADASSVLLFPFMTPEYRLIPTMIYGVLCTGAVGSSAGFRPVLCSYILPVMGTMMLAWPFMPDTTPNGHYGLWLALILAISIIGLLGIAKDYYGIFQSAVLARIEQMQLNQRLRTTLEQAEAANAAKTRFLASASHDLRQPLHSLSLFFATLRLQVKAPENTALLDHIDQALHALQSQMNTLLDMSKLDAGMVALNWGAFPLAPMVAQLRSAYLPVAQQKGLMLYMNCPAHLIVHSDAEQLGRVLRNLIDNAFKYTRAGWVRLDAFEQDDRIAVRVCDSGCGIAPSMHKHVFEEFFQVDNPERDRDRGLGLGLSIVRRLAHLLHLQIDLQSALNEGTSVTLTIPQGTSHAADPVPHPELRDAQASVPMCQVLVLDDEAAVRAGMQALLQRMGCVVMLASCIDEALAQAVDRQPDLVLADLRLRGTESGIEAVTQLRQRHPGLPAIIITGDTAPDRLRQAQAAGLPVLHKPVAADALMTAIAAALEAAS